MIISGYATPLAVELTYLEEMGWEISLFSEIFHFIVTIYETPTETLRLLAKLANEPVPLGHGVTYGVSYRIYWDPLDIVNVAIDFVDKDFIGLYHASMQYFASHSYIQVHCNLYYPSVLSHPLILATESTLGAKNLTDISFSFNRGIMSSVPRKYFFFELMYRVRSNTLGS
jgi:hypothetical protein